MAIIKRICLSLIITEIAYEYLSKCPTVKYFLSSYPSIGGVYKFINQFIIKDKFKLFQGSIKSIPLASLFEGV